MNAATHDHRHPRIPRARKPSAAWIWLMAIALIVVLSAIWSWAGQREERERAAARTSAAKPARTVQPGALMHIDIDAMCPKRSDHSTDIVVFTIKSRADGINEFEGCTRIAKRSYLIPGRVITSQYHESQP